MLCTALVSYISNRYMKYFSARDEIKCNGFKTTKYLTFIIYLSYLFYQPPAQAALREWQRVWQVQLTSVEAAVVLLAETRGDPDAGLDLATDVPRGQQVEQHHRDRVLLHVIVTEMLINITLDLLCNHNGNVGM